METSLRNGVLVGLVDVIITLTKVRSAIVKAIPDQIKHAIAAGIGLFIAYIGLKMRDS
ncbi:Guanine/hypoxanthine permease PbuO [Weissella viridescens]|uniref:Guanine/hypoxanthine permease PbuO n=1 Tax=Weissella viridescens TaxID=1629 RepID=A0A380P7L5_WEIVI|nr:Guanine/hypoxanthine permease PbuO [Weissella viridescens]